MLPTIEALAFKHEHRTPRSLLVVWLRPRVVPSAHFWHFLSIINVEETVWFLDVFNETLFMVVMEANIIVTAEHCYPDVH